MRKEQEKIDKHKKELEDQLEKTNRLVTELNIKIKETEDAEKVVRASLPTLLAVRNVLLAKVEELKDIIAKNKPIEIEKEPDSCVICMEDLKNTAMYKCGHLCCCNSCALKVKICPICREPVLDVLKIYRV